MVDVLSLFPLDFLGLAALVCVILAMVALGTGVRLKALRRGVPAGPLAVALGIALVLVPALALLAGELFALSPAALVGLLLMGISPGAPLALRRSRDAGGDDSFSIVLQVSVALLAIVAVPLWIMLLGAIYAREAGISLALLARQVFVAQLLPLGAGIAFASIAPDFAARVAGPLLRLSGWILAAVALLILAHVWKSLAGLSLAAPAASLAVTVVTVGIAHVACGPLRSRQMAAAIVCSLRNPGIAFLVASANGLPEGAKVMIVAHALVTAAVLAVYVAVMRRRDTGRLDTSATG